MPGNDIHFTLSILVDHHGEGKAPPTAAPQKIRKRKRSNIHHD